MSEYFIHTPSGQQGPFKADELLAAGLTKDSMIWREGLASWVKAGELEEIKNLFAVIPPPFSAEKTGSAATPPPLPGNKTAPPTVPASKFNLKKYALPIGILVLLLAVGGYFYFKKDKKSSDTTEEKMALAKTDSTATRDTVKTDTVKKVNPDTLSNWMVTDSSFTQTTDTGVNQNADFIIPGMPTTNKNKVKKETTKETTQPQKQKNNLPANQKNIVTVPKEEEKKVPVKALVIHGGFHKNLLLEAVMEGTIRNVNKNASFRNIVVTVNFIDDDGRSLGSQQFTQPGVMYAGDVSSFKFKSRAPKGTKSASYAASGTVF